MHGLLITIVLFGIRFFSPQPDPFIDPTGTYMLKGEMRNNRQISNAGEIRVKLIDSERLAICFYINKGYPGYESAAFVDTLNYNDNKAAYHPQTDKGCTIVFTFNRRSAELSQIFSEPQTACVFANGILISAVFEKTSSDFPVIKDLSAHGISQ